MLVEPRGFGIRQFPLEASAPGAAEMKISPNGSLP